MSSMYQTLTLKTTISRHRFEMNADTGWIPEETARGFFSSYSLPKDTSLVLSDCYIFLEVEQMAFKVALMLKSQLFLFIGNKSETLLVVFPDR